MADPSNCCDRLRALLNECLSISDGAAMTLVSIRLSEALDELRKYCPEELRRKPAT